MSLKEKRNKVRPYIHLSVWCFLFSLAKKTRFLYKKKKERKKEIARNLFFIKLQCNFDDFKSKYLIMNNCSPRRSPTPVFTMPEENNCFSIISIGEYQGLQNNGLKHENTDVIVRFHTHMCSRSFNNMYIDYESIYSSSSAVKQTSETLRKINSPDTVALSLSTTFTVDIIVYEWIVLVWRKKYSVNRSDQVATKVTTAFTILKFLEYGFLKGFVVQGRQQSFWKFSILSNVLDLEWYRSNKWKLHQATVCHVYLPRWQRWQA